MRPLRLPTPSRVHPAPLHHKVPGRAWQGALEALCECPAPRTPEGIQRKGKVALLALRRFHAALVPGEITLALSALEDVAERAGA